jgi:membrane dipeptidase
MNALLLNRDLTKSVYEIRQTEKGMTQKGRAMGTVAFPEMRQGEVFVSLATTIGRLAKRRETDDRSVGIVGSNSPEIAYASAYGQLAYYRILEYQGEVRIIKDSPTLELHLKEWQKLTHDGAPLGLILAMEGADNIVSPSQLKPWWEEGFRVVGLTHYGFDPRGYAGGTESSQGLTPRGRELLEAMDSVGMILDVTHMSDESFWEALDLFKGPILASHNNCRALVPGPRQFSDEQLQALIKRHAVIGTAADAWMLYPNWTVNTPKTAVSLENMVDHIHHICQLAGNTLNAALGTDLDGGYGREQSPHDLDTIADLQKIPALLEKRGYSVEDVKRIMHGNWLRLFHDAWRKM